MEEEQEGRKPPAVEASVETRSTEQLVGVLLPAPFCFLRFHESPTRRWMLDCPPEHARPVTLVTWVVALLYLPSRVNPAATAGALTAARNQARNFYHHAKDEVVAPASHIPDSRAFLLSGEIKKLTMHLTRAAGQIYFPSHPAPEVWDVSEEE